MSVLLNLDFICIEHPEILEKERFKYTIIRQTTVHVIYEQVTCRENYTVVYLYKWKYKYTSFCYLSIPNERYYEDIDWSIMM